MSFKIYKDTITTQFVINTTKSVLGYMDYNDASTSIAPVDIDANVWVDIPNDGAGEFTSIAYAPIGVTRLLDTTTGYVDFSQLNVGDCVSIRNDFTVTPNLNNSLLKFRYVAGLLYPFTQEQVLGRLDTGAGLGYRFSLKADLLYIGSEDVRDGPVKLQVKLSDPGTLVNAGTVIKINR